jgi:tetratricopeptide (TPR) repeat protein
MERDFALRQLSRAEAIDALNNFVLSEARSKKQLTVNEQLEGAERLVAKQRGRATVVQAELLLHIGEQYLVLTHYPKAREVLTQAYTLARALPEQSTRARTSCALAIAVANQGDLPGAEKLIVEGLNDIPDDARFAIERVYCLQSGSTVALRRGYPREALNRAQAAQRALFKSPLRSGSRELDNLVLLASAYQYSGQVREANTAFEQASARLAEMGRDETERARILFNNWGLALLSWGRPLESERMLGKAMSLGQDKGDANPALMVNYSRSLVELGRLEDAAEYAERSYSKAQAMGNPVGISETLLERAIIYRTQGNLDRATQMLTELESTLRRNYPADDIIFGDLAIERALVAQARGDAPAALDLANQAVAMAEASLKKRGAGAGFVQSYLLSRSEIQQQLGRKDEAEADARRSLKILLDKAQPGTFSSKLGRAYLRLGRTLLVQIKRQEAGAAFRSAVENLENALGADNPDTRAARELAGLQVPIR